MQSEANHILIPLARPPYFRHYMLMRPLLIGAAGGLLLLSSCSQDLNRILPASSSVTRSEALSISKAYTDLAWTPREDNALHGKDPDGIMVETPDKKPDDTTTYYWVSGQKTLGMPYQWGGFDTPGEFLSKVSQKNCPAGDMATPEKIRRGDDLVSQYAAGIDCSGCVSRCWRLGRPHSTRELPALCDHLNSYQDLKAGDILIIPGDHVIMFIKWNDAHKKSFVGSEAAGSIYHRVVVGNYQLDRFIAKGFTPMRYKKIRS